MENFVVSARKYRPLQFEDVVGQLSITETLEHAIGNNQLAQALLFCGPRGVGKTTCARILARKINEENNQIDEENQDFAFNIFELDAASNNSVDDIRSLIDQVRFAPQVGKYKVYIIDEVHMLSQAAFNAFLKTLEEPPAHAIFILATTEKHKIIPTILSRCQIYDFKRISINDIKLHLESIAKRENTEYEEDALHLIAQKADGALRDALSIFDRMVTFTGGKLTLEKVAENLNVLDYEYYFKITDAALKNEIPNLMIQFNDILNKGFDAHLFISGLGGHFRDLLVAKIPQTIDLLEVGENTKIKYLDQAQRCDSQFLINAIEICNTADINYKTSKNPRLTVEIALMQLGSLTAENTIDKKKFRIIPPQGAPIEIPKINPPQEKTESKVEQAKFVHPETVAPKEEIVPEVKRVDKPIASQKPTPVSFNLKNIFDKVEEEKTVVEDRNNLPKEKFTESEFMKVWNEFVENLKLQKQIPAYNALHTAKITFVDELKVIFEFSSLSLSSEFDLQKDALVRKIREKLKNYYIEFEVKISEAEIVQNYIKSKSEIFKEMAEKNPVLLKMKNEFGLDLNSND